MTIQYFLMAVDYLLMAVDYLFMAVDYLFMAVDYLFMTIHYFLMAIQNNFILRIGITNTTIISHVCLHGINSSENIFKQQIQHYFCILIRLIYWKIYKTIKYFAPRCFDIKSQKFLYFPSSCFSHALTFINII